jgi:hypothetical protein
MEMKLQGELQHARATIVGHEKQLAELKAQIAQGAAALKKAATVVRVVRAYSQNVWTHTHTHKHTHTHSYTHTHTLSLSLCSFFDFSSSFLLFPFIFLLLSFLIVVPLLLCDRVSSQDAGTAAELSLMRSSLSAAVAEASSARAQRDVLQVTQKLTGTSDVCGCCCSFFVCGRCGCCGCLCVCVYVRVCRSFYCVICCCLRFVRGNGGECVEMIS